MPVLQDQTQRKSEKDKMLYTCQIRFLSLLPDIIRMLFFLKKKKRKSVILKIPFKYQYDKTWNVDFLEV